VFDARKNTSLSLEVNAEYTKYTFMSRHHIRPTRQSCDKSCFNYQLNAQFLYFVIIYYIIILDMFRAIIRSSSGGQIVLLQQRVSSLSVSGRTVHRLGADFDNMAKFKYLETTSYNFIRE
jgi:hypothetical protein